jgi:glutathione S-transferase
MKLYYSKGACSLAVRIILNELAIPCDYEAVDLKTKKTETGLDYFTINFKGAVPVLVLDNQEVLTENSIIQQYLADQYKATQLLPPVGDFKRYRVLEWLNFVSSDLHKGFGPLFNANVSEAMKEEIFKPILKNKFNFVEKRLANNKFLLGDHFTLPDGYLFVVLRWAQHFKILSTFPHLSRYFSDLQKRPSVQKSLKEEGLL